MACNDIDGEEVENDEDEDEMEETTMRGVKEEEDDRENDDQNGIEGDDNEEEEEDSHENTPRKVRPKKAKKAKKSKKKRKRSSSVESMEDEEEKIPAPMSTTNKEIKQGPEYQAVVPEGLSPYPADHEDTDERIWYTPESMDDTALLRYISNASERFRYPVDRSLYILKHKQFDVMAARRQIRKRNELRDLWSPDESVLFFNCFLSFGKNFRRIQTMMPHRSMRSLIQHYYDSKKRINYRLFADAPLGEGCEIENYEEDEKKHALKLLDKMCANCGEYAEQMEVRNPLDKIKIFECNICLRFHTKHGLRRPTNAQRVLEERAKTVVGCPEYMEDHMNEYPEMMNAASGETYSRRKMGPNQSIEDITHVDYVLETMKLAKESVDHLDKPGQKGKKKSWFASWNPATPFIWQKKQTRCMEQCEVIFEDARRKKFNSVVSISRVSMRILAVWRHEVESLRWRMDRTTGDYDLLPGVLCVTSRCRQSTEWNEKDRKSALQCFTWYGNQFEFIADVIGNKTEEQILKFYEENMQMIDVSIETYRLSMRMKCEEFNENKMDGFGAANEVPHVDDPIDSDESREGSESPENPADAGLANVEAACDGQKEKANSAEVFCDDSAELNKSQPLENFGVTDDDGNHSEEVVADEESHEFEEEENANEVIDLGTSKEMSPPKLLIQEENGTAEKTEQIESIRECNGPQEKIAIEVTEDKIVIEQLEELPQPVKPETIEEIENPVQTEEPAGQESHTNINEENGVAKAVKDESPEVEDELESGEEAGYDSQDDSVDEDDEEDFSEEMEDSEEDEPVQKVKKALPVKSMVKSAQPHQIERRKDTVNGPIESLLGSSVTRASTSANGSTSFEGNH